MNTFVTAATSSIDDALTTTENGMVARVSTADKVLDFFAFVGNARQVSEAEILSKFSGAYAENRDLALRSLLWARDVRGGAGERRVFRLILSWLDSTQPKDAASVLRATAEVGRWDDLLIVKNPSNRAIVAELVRAALAAGNGLCAKWMPRKGSDSVWIARALGHTPKSWRKLIVGLTNVVESTMCQKEWNAIEFSKVPSLASIRYQKAFARNAADTYQGYLDALTRGDEGVKINAAAVYPYQVVQSVERGNAQAANAQWDALPNFVGNASILPMVDVSGSMETDVANSTTAMDVAVSLGLYLSEKNTGAYKDLFLTFSGSPEFVKLKGTLDQRLMQMKRSDWAMNTNLEKAFAKILKVAVDNDVKAEDMPEYLLILSDMQFDEAVRSPNARATEMIRARFAEAGYAVPKLVFWNIVGGGRAGGNAPVRFDETGTALVSGFSPAIMKAVLSNDLQDFTPLNVMLEALMQDRYDLASYAK